MSRSRPPSPFAFWAFVAWLAITLMWWALAFAPLPLPPVWLAAARSVCFGSSPTGLPEPWGWAGLIASPLAMLAFLLGVWGRDLGRHLRWLAAIPVGRVVLAVLLAVPLLAAGWVANRVIRARAAEAAQGAVALPADLPEGYPRDGRAAPPLDLLSQSGGTLSLASLAGRPAFLTFAFAHCRTVCPVIVETVRRAAEEASELEPAVVVVTLDPWRDTPSSLPSVAHAWRLDELPRSWVLSGEVPRVLTVLDAWGVPHERDPRSGDVVHPGVVHVLGRDGVIGYTFNAPPIAWLVEAARRLAAAPGRELAASGQPQGRE